MDVTLLCTMGILSPLRVSVSRSVAPAFCVLPGGGGCFPLPMALGALGMGHEGQLCRPGDGDISPPRAPVLPMKPQGDTCQFCHFMKLLTLGSLCKEEGQCPPSLPLCGRPRALAGSPSDQFPGAALRLGTWDFDTWLCHL